MLNEFRSQSICDSTYMVCDSVFIDSIFLTSFGDDEWLAMQVSVDHDFIYAPNLHVCPSIDSIMFLDETMEFTSIFGPSSHFVHYVFQDFNFPLNFELAGNLVVDNFNNSFNNCQIPFSITINEPTGIDDSSLENKIEIFPNPVNDLLIVQFLDGNDDILDIQLFNLAGVKQNINITDEGVELSAIASGLYTIHIALRNGQLIVKKAIKL
ncbi:MAG: hypothetical protein ACI8XB_000894 [Patiriisocius sp.]|jgi:hypothetical protein